VKVDAEVLRRVAGPFLSQDPQGDLFAAICCSRVYVGPVEPTKCRTCTTVPRAIKISVDSDLDKVALDLTSAS
jgi:hypothetical protein